MNIAIRPSARNAGSQPDRARPGQPFIHLKVHSSYSLLEGALKIGAIAKLAEKHAMPAVGLTDTNNLFGALEFSEKLAAAGIQPIVGCTVGVDFRDLAAPAGGLPRNATNEPRSKPAGRIALLASDERGYGNLMRLSKRLFFEPDPVEEPHLKIAHLEELGDGLIVLTGGPDGPIDRALREGQSDRALDHLMRLAQIFGDRLYVELQRHGLAHEEEVEPLLLEHAYEHGLPIVATNEAYFATPDDFEAHDALLCIAEGRTISEDDRRRVTREHYFKNTAEMAETFRDLPEALDTTLEIAKRCAFRPTGRKPILPRFVRASDAAATSDQLALEAAELERQAREGLAARLAEVPLPAGFTEEDYWKRLSYELGVIERMKFPGYFLIVADFIKWAKANGIPVGPGRGSGAGSVVAWALTITDLDPLRFGLLFERFLNPERISMPDFDIDFCQDRREEVIRYVQGKYGADRVAQIITHGKLQARAVLRDVGRVLQMPYGQVDKLCKLVPNNPANPVTLPEAIAGEPKLQEARDSEPVVGRLLEIAQKLEGLYRHASTHAAGMVIGDRPLDELVPLYRDPKSNFPITQFNWKMVEAAGLVKFDFLGLKTLTVLQKAVELIARGRGIAIDLAKLPLDDQRSYELLARADTAGVFQLEGTGMRESLKRLKPDRFEDIIAMVALYRPGPMDNIPTYINRKHGEEPIDYPHVMLEPILKETYGVIIYQEQVMQIAQVLAGYSLGEADLLRRAMGKKDKAEMAKQQARFVDGAMKNGVPKKDAVYIFELVDKFAGYGFNKSHAAAYALVSYHTAYIKANFREEFFAASMTLDMGNTDKLAMFAAEARKSGIEVRPPCVNSSGVEFLVEYAVRATDKGLQNRSREVLALAPSGQQDGDDAGAQAERGAIRYSLAALKNIGAGAVETIVAARSGQGSFRTLGDFAQRANLKTLGKRGLETLSQAGAFDALEANRALVHGNVESMMGFANRLAENEAIGTSDLFGGLGSGPSAAPDLDLRPIKAWTPMQRLEKEFEAVGFYLSGHPLDQYESVLATLGVQSWSSFEAATERGVTAARLAGVVVAARERKSQKGNKFAFAAFSDPTGQYEAVIFSDTLAAARDLLEPGTPVLITVEAERDGDTVKMRAQSIEALDRAAGLVQRGLVITFDAAALSDAKVPLKELRSALAVAGRGEIRLALRLAETGREIEVELPGRYDVGPAVRGALSIIPGVLALADIRQP
jgi:DNA polymerase-3 subunit alpha